MAFGLTRHGAGETDTAQYLKISLDSNGRSSHVLCSRCESDGRLASRPASSLHKSRRAAPEWQGASSEHIAIQEHRDDGAVTAAGLKRRQALVGPKLTSTSRLAPKTDNLLQTPGNRYCSARSRVKHRT
jgi:hypothetical protein